MDLKEVIDRLQHVDMSGPTGDAKNFLKRAYSLGFQIMKDGDTYAEFLEKEAKEVLRRDVEATKKADAELAEKAKIKAEADVADEAKKLAEELSGDVKGDEGSVPKEGDSSDGSDTPELHQGGSQPEQGGDGSGESDEVEKSGEGEEVLNHTGTDPNATEEEVEE